MKERTYLNVLTDIVKLLIELTQTDQKQKEALIKKVNRRFFMSILNRIMGNLPDDKFTVLEKEIYENTSDTEKVMKIITQYSQDSVSEETRMLIAIEELEGIVKSLISAYRSTVSPKAWEVTKKTIDTWLDEIPNEEPISPVVSAAAA